MYDEAEYALQKIKDNHWIAHKFDGHHGRYDTGYVIKKGANGWYCTCKAAHGCKHIKMVLAEMSPKKSLF